MIDANTPKAGKEVRVSGARLIPKPTIFSKIINKKLTTAAKIRTTTT